MALKKSDLYSSLWKGADELRGSMDASQYKDYVLTLLFVKYVSDKAKASKNSLIVVPKGSSFDDLLLLKNKPDIGEQINVAIRALADENDLVGVINNANFNDPNKLGDGKDMVARLSNLLGIFQDLDFSGSRAEGDDLLGDAYEYLMRHFATESGKSKGQFYTPAEVSRIMAQLIGITSSTPKSATVYDPTCGSGSLLLKVADAAPNGLTVYGQEMDNATWALSVMNMILHGNETAEIAPGNTLTTPKFLKDAKTIQTFDFVVANPPFSVKTWTNGLEEDYGRFEFGRPPEKNGDFAFLLHILKSMKSTGKGAVILPHGVLFRGNAEANIRREIVKRGFIKAIVGLPTNLFYGTGIPACILILDKESAADRRGIFMIDASKGFEKDGPKNRLRPRDMHKIVDVLTRQLEVPRYSRMVPLDEIADVKNDYNLNIPRYVDSSEPEDIQDLHAHLQGGIPDRDLDALQPYWEAFPSLRATLFERVRPGYSDLIIDKSAIQATITGSSEYRGFRDDVTNQLSQWWTGHSQELEHISATTRPPTLIESLGEELLARFRSRPLIDEYGVYEQLMRYWHETMHDDVALVMSEGWLDASRPRPARILGEDKNKKPIYEDAHIVFGTGVKAARWVADLLPPELIIDRYFKSEKDAFEQLQAAVDAATQAIVEYVAENAVEDGLLFEAADEDGNVTSRLATDRLQAAKVEGGQVDEIASLNHLLTLFKAEAAAKRAVREAKVRLEQATLSQYGRLDESAVKDLVIEDKWNRTIALGIQNELALLTRQLVDRLRVLTDRYEETLSNLDRKILGTREEVSAHLALLGADELLSGARRLPGFTDEWQEVTLGEHVTYVKTVALSRAQLDKESPIHYLHYGDIHTSDDIMLNAATTPMPRASADRIKTAGFLQVGDLVFADASEDPDGVGKSVEITGVPANGVVPGLHTIAARFDKAVLADGFKAYLQYMPEFRSALLRLAAGTKVLATTRAYISSVSLRLPGIPEQRAIATALSAASREISLIRQRLQKTKAIEVGMRQQLLSGQVQSGAGSVI
ncbi:type I restriction endonuclease subunit M [Rathayibacter sp. AY1C6]|uniref:N-6 DNA methylase n=1 Tax=Rathayibacter sp. AY1C6 TaxID=2080539 RepID=UPI000CE82B48|nr:N-6 DNA methylase [Rathayibacter sp. AY1C6]PPG15152.1 type I restriction endonuclease subunit M [Rathayibacter sp. AY1C6]